MPSRELQFARIVAGTLTLLSREIREVGHPVDLWSPELSPEIIRETAAKVGHGEALPLWVDERHPARGLLIYTPSPWESDFFGFGCTRLLGPFMVVEDQLDRENRVRGLARQAIELGRQQNQSLLTIKTPHDPAFMRGFLGVGFVVAEIGCSLKGAVNAEGHPVEKPGGFLFLDRDDLPEMAADTVAALGDFFYDGHYRHDPLPGPDQARNLWSRVAFEDLTGQADPAVVLWDRGRDRPAGLATVRLYGRTAFLSILAVTPSYRGRGFGRLLLSEAMNRLAGQADEIRVETAAYNLPAQALYLSLGLIPAAPLAAFHYHYV